MTNREYMIQLLSNPNNLPNAYDAMVYYHIACPLIENDDGECKYKGKEFDWRNCAECKKEWLESGVGE